MVGDWTQRSWLDFYVLNIWDDNSRGAQSTCFYWVNFSFIFWCPLTIGSDYYLRHISSMCLSILTSIIFCFAHFAPCWFETEMMQPKLLVMVTLVLVWCSLSWFCVSRCDQHWEDWWAFPPDLWCQGTLHCPPHHRRGGQGKIVTFNSCSKASNLNWNLVYVFFLPTFLRLVASLTTSGGVTCLRWM